MANELISLPNPDNKPGGISSGYQRQNNNLFTIQTGLDTCEPYEEDPDIVIIPVGGIIEFNGLMFKIGQNVELVKSNPLSMYWIAVTDNGNGTASANLVTRAGAWSPYKQGCYLPDGRRILTNFIPWRTGFIPSKPIIDRVYYKDTFGDDKVILRKGWYLINLQSGKGGVDGEKNEPTGGKGGRAVNGISKSFEEIIFLNKNEVFDVSVGRGGLDGGQGFHYGGGGGSGGGEKTLLGPYSTEEVPGGFGGIGRSTYGGNPGQHGMSYEKNLGGRGYGELSGGGGGVDFDEGSTGGPGGKIGDNPETAGSCAIYKLFD